MVKIQSDSPSVRYSQRFTTHFTKSDAYRPPIISYIIKLKLQNLIIINYNFIYFRVLCIELVSY